MLRSDQTTPAEFRRVLREITFYLGYEATSALSTKTVDISTPMTTTTGQKLSTDVALIPIMRAGLGMVDAMLELLPNSDVYHIGMYRSSGSLLPIQYYNKVSLGSESREAFFICVSKHCYSYLISLLLPFLSQLPRDKSADVAYVLDPMIATAGTICAVVNILKKWGASHVHVISVLASKAGLAKLRGDHPDVSVTVTHVDDVLDDQGMMSPGLGDAGDRLYATPTIDQDDDEKLLSPSKRKRTLSK